jgi:hypothetical protein
MHIYIYIYIYMFVFSSSVVVEPNGLDFEMLTSTHVLFFEPNDSVLMLLLETVCFW